MTDQCQCTGAGWCERHRVNKDEVLVRLCQRRGDYWEAWEQGRGPGQLNRVPPSQMGIKPVNLPQKREGWGDNVTKALKKIGITEDRYKEVKAMFGLPPTCGCPQRREWLNKVGRWWTGEE